MSLISSQVKVANLEVPPTVQPGSSTQIVGESDGTMLMLGSSLGDALAPIDGSELGKEDSVELGVALGTILGPTLGSEGGEVGLADCTKVGLGERDGDEDELEDGDGLGGTGKWSPPPQAQQAKEAVLLLKSISPNSTQSFVGFAAKASHPRLSLKYQSASSIHSVG